MKQKEIFLPCRVSSSLQRKMYFLTASPHNSSFVPPSKLVASGDVVQALHDQAGNTQSFDNSPLSWLLTHTRRMAQANTPQTPGLTLKQRPTSMGRNTGFLGNSKETRTPGTCIQLHFPQSLRQNISRENVLPIEVLLSPPHA